MDSKIAVALICALTLFLFGCTTLGNDSASLDKLTSIQQNYLVKSGFSANLATMNDYISAISELKSSSGGSAGRIIEAELYSAQTFYYYNKALVESTSISYQTMKCSSSEVKSTISSINIAKEYSAKAINSINLLLESERSKLRPNQLDTVKNYSDQITQIQSFFKENC